MLPAFIVVFSLLLYPMAHSLYESFYKHSFIRPYEGRPFIGFQNYIEAFQDPVFQVSLKNTFLFAVGIVSITTLLAIGVSLLFNENIRGVSVLMAILLIPWAVPPIANAIMWRWMLLPEHGVFTQIFFRLGLLESGSVGWLANQNTAMLAIIIAQAWKMVPFSTLLFLSALKMIRQDLVDATMVDGASPVQRFRHLTIPFLKPAITISLILNTMTSIKAFDLIYALTQGGPGYATYVLQFYAYRVGFEHMEMGYGSAIAWIVSLLIFVFTVVYYRLVYKEMAY